MNTEEFAARRRAIFTRADADLRPLVSKALDAYAAGEADWSADLIEASEALWLETFLEEAPNANPDSPRRGRYVKEVTAALDQTDQPEGEPLAYEIDRLTRWLGTFTVNDATWSGAGARGVRNKRWVAMPDTRVRETHDVADGQTRPIAAPFNVGGYELRFPGDPVGPPEIWINCRCVIQPAARRGEMGVTPTTFAITDETDIAVEVADEEDLPTDDLEDDEEEITEIPVHGVLAPEGVATGDGRMFAEGGLSTRDLPLPIAYQLLSGDGHAGSATVGRIDDVFRQGNEMRFRGALITTKEHTGEVIEGIIDGTVRGVSVDVDDIEVDMAISEDGMEQTGKMPLTVFSHARIAGVTIVALPAFQEAFIGLGHEFADELSAEALAACAACADEGPEDLDENEDIEVGYDVYRDVPAGERKNLAKKGQAMPDGSYPIANVQDLKNAIQAIGRAKDPAAVKRHIKKRARALGHPELIPEGWSSLAEMIADAPILDLTVLTDDEQAAYDEADDKVGWMREHHPEAITAAAGTHDGDVGTLISWSVLSSDAMSQPEVEGGVRSTTAAGNATATLSTRGVATGRLIFSTIEPTTMSAGSGRDIGTVLATGGSPSHPASAHQRIESSMSGASAPSQTGSSSTTFAATVDASTPPTASPSATARTSPAATAATAARGGSVAGGSMTSPSPTPGTSGLSMEFSDGRVVPVISTDAPSGIVRLSDGIVLAAGRPLTFSNPSTRDGPGWITHPIPTGRIRRYWVRGKGALKIKWGVPGDFNRCRRQLAKYITNPKWLAGACANMHKEAIGIWPGMEGGKRKGHALAASGHREPIFNLVASSNRVLDSKKFERVDLADPRVGIMIEDDHIYGYVAQWGVCHIGVEGMCRETPHSQTDYWYYATGLVDTDIGSVRVGQITMDTGHAPLRATARVAAAHYDNTGAAVADVAVGEDGYGIWFSGVLRPGVTDDQRHALRASGRLSGDWRELGGNLEMVAALAVNVGGLPIPHVLAASANGQQISLIAAGMVPFPDGKSDFSASVGIDPELVAGIARTAVAEYRHQEKVAGRADPLRQALRQKKVESLRQKIKE